MIVVGRIRFADRALFAALTEPRSSLGPPGNDPIAQEKNSGPLAGGSRSLRLGAR